MGLQRKGPTDYSIVSTMLVAAVPGAPCGLPMTKTEEKILACWKYFLSLFKRNWTLSDYPIRIRKQKIDPDYSGGRLKQHGYSAQIVNWWVVGGSGDTEEEALQDLQKAFSRITAERAKCGKKLPRPGTHVELEFASRERVDAHPELAADFIRRVLNLEWAWISDESSLWDFYSSDDNQALIAKINEVYGVDVSNIESAKIWEILDRIAAHRAV
jgi:hypothetical protein